MSYSLALQSNFQLLLGGLQDREVKTGIHSATSEVVEVKRSFSRSLRPNFGFHLVLTSFHLEFLSFWISRLFDLGDLHDLENGPSLHFKNGLKSIQIFQILMGGMNRRQRAHKNQMSSAVRGDQRLFILVFYWSQKIMVTKDTFCLFPLCDSLTRSYQFQNLSRAFDTT